MLPADRPTSENVVRKLEPTAKLPTPAVLKSLCDDDVRLIERRLGEPLEFFDSPRFAQPDAESAIMAPLPAGPTPRRRKAQSSDDSGIDLLGSGAPTCTTQQEQRLFERLNYCRFRVFCVLNEADARRLSAEAATETVRWERASVATRDQIVRSNVPLVLAMAKRTRITGVDYSDLISEGNLALMRSVDKFDWGRGFKFSTYACRAILKAFSRVAMRTSRHRGHFPTEFDPTLERSDFQEQRRSGVENDCVQELRAILGENAAGLNDIERQVLNARFALGAQAAPDGTRSMTLEQVGEMIGVTKERVRQIQNKALGKLRAVLEQGILANN